MYKSSIQLQLKVKGLAASFPTQFTLGTINQCLVVPNLCFFRKLLFKTEQPKFRREVSFGVYRQFGGTSAKMAAPIATDGSRDHLDLTYLTKLSEIKFETKSFLMPKIRFYCTF